MKLLIYTHAFAPMIGGIETYTMLLARGLAEGETAQAMIPEVTVATRALANGMDDSKLPFRVVRNPGLVRLWTMVRDADVIHIANPALLPMLLAWLLRKRTLVEHDGYQSACPNGMFFYEPTQSDCPGHFLAGRYRECLRCTKVSVGKWRSIRIVLLTFPRRWLCSRMTVHIGPSKHVANRVRMPRTQIIYHGLPFPADSVSSATEIPSSPTCFAYVGRFVQEKGVSVFLRAAQQLAEQGWEFRIKLVGDGPLRADLERMTDELGLRPRACFTGFLQGADLRDAMKGVTAAVMPSICEDVAPLASIEHMMNGLPIVASDIGGLGELVEGVGLKFAAGDAQAMANCLLKFLKDPVLAAQLKSKGLQRAQTMFTREVMLKNHIEAYTKMDKK